MHARFLSKHMHHLLKIDSVLMINGISVSDCNDNTRGLGEVQVAKKIPKGIQICATRCAARKSYFLSESFLESNSTFDGLHVHLINEVCFIKQIASHAIHKICATDQCNTAIAKHRPDVMISLDLGVSK